MIHSYYHSDWSFTSNFQDNVHEIKLVTFAELAGKKAEPQHHEHDKKPRRKQRRRKNEKQSTTAN